MLGRLGLTHFCARRDPTYVRLTLEFLSSLVYTTQSWTASTISFYMFNKEYQFNLKRSAELLQFLYGEGVICETPLDIDWVHECQT